MGPRITHGDLPVGPLRVAQSLAVAWLVTGQSLVWPGTPAWSVLGAACSTALCAAIILTRWTRSASAGLAALIVLGVAADPSWFSNNRLFVAAVLFAIGLMSNAVPALARWQVGLVYLVAAADKALAPAWRDGQFIGSFLEQLARFGLMWSPAGQVGSPNPLAQWLAATGAPSLWVAGGLLVIALEVVLGLGFLFNLGAVAWVNALFHVGVFALTGGTMGQFFYAGAAASLLLVPPRFVPSAGAVIAVTALLASPWTHRFLPVLLLAAAAAAWWRRRRSSAATAPAPETG